MLDDTFIALWNIVLFSNQILPNLVKSSWSN